MKISHEKSDNNLGVIIIKVESSDYLDTLENKLLEYKKNAVIPGFRKGKVPIGIINKKYRVPLLVDEVNKLIQKEIYTYISNENLQILGSPIPKPNNDINWERQDSFNFEFEIGFSPKLDFKISSKDKLNYYKIIVDQEMIDSYVLDITKRHGKMSNVDVSIEGDLIYCDIIQLDKNKEILEGGIKNKATVSMDFLKNKKSKSKFIGVKIEDNIIINLFDVFDKNSDLASMLNVSKEDLTNLESDKFSFKVINISRLEPAKIDKDLFQKIYGDDTVKNKKQFRDKINKETSKNFDLESDRMLKNDVVDYLIKKIQISLPDDFLKKWLMHTSKEEITLEQIEKEYEMYSKSMKWQLIENEIISSNNIKVTEEELKSHTQKLIEFQMKQYNQPVPLNEKMEEIVSNILSNDDEKKKIYDQIYDKKTISFYKDNFKLSEKTITYDDFIKLATEKK
tara:strand:+ start:1217 stop:2572 length:1356 start_codon:yes stop_codon:yes gene_type:complete